MKSASLSSASHLSATTKPAGLDALACRLVLRRLGALRHGRIRLVHDGQEAVFGEPGGAGVMEATITVCEARFWSDIAFGGSIGAGEAYMQGAWHCDDLVALVRIMLRNRSVLEGMEGGWARLSRPLQKLFHWVNRNTRTGARRNIAAHYDLGNEFFALWLDPSMMYSSAIFERPDMTLAEAQLARLDAVCRKLDLGPDDHVIEIGSGWGGFAIYAAERHGCRVTTTTISRRQYALTQERVAAAGLGDRITVLMQDYRDLRGRFDKLVSLEMIEAIDSYQYDSYFNCCSELLKPGGRMLIQAITIADRRYAQAQKSVDFIQRYIFPGSCLPCVSVMVGTIARVSDLQVTGIEDIGLHYATTLNHWRRNFFARLDEVRALGYPEAFIRMWEYYFCYCEGGFLERAISDVHLLAEKPG